MGSSLLSVDNLSVAFHSRRDTLRVIDGVSLSIDPGEVVAVVGESGAGKSVTGTAVLGLLDSNAQILEGTITLAGQEIQALTSAQMEGIRGRLVGAIFQDPMSSLDPLMRIGDQLVETIRCHSSLSHKEAERMAADLLQEVGIADAERRLRHYPHEFSGGMRQRVVIALALCGSPKLLIADEPTTALDAWTQVQIVSLLKRLCRDRGMGAMLITHDMSIVSAIADRVVVMYAGRVVESGRTQDILEDPRHPYTRGLMAAIPKIGDARKRLNQIAGSMLPPAARGDFCGFAPRCSKVMPTCRTARPPSINESDRTVACWLGADDRSEGRHVA